MRGWVRVGARTPAACAVGEQSERAGVLAALAGSGHARVADYADVKLRTST